MHPWFVLGAKSARKVDLMTSHIPQGAIEILQEIFGRRFMWHATGEPDANNEPSASVFPQSADEVAFLTRLAADHDIPLVARGAGTAIYPGKAPPALLVRFDAMNRIRLPKDATERWVEVEPGATWMALLEGLRERGIGPTVYPTSAPRSTVGGWLAENGVGIGSFEYGWLLQNVLRVEAVLAGGGRQVIEGEALRHFVGSRGTMAFFVRARLATRRASADVPVGAIFKDAQNLGNAVLDLYRGGVPLWHLAFLTASMSRARGFEEEYVLFGAYPEERSHRVEPAFRRVVGSRQGRVLGSEEAESIWEKRFFPAGPLGPTPTPGRAFVQGARLAEALVEIERKLAGVALQGTAALWGEVALLAFDPAAGSEGLVDLSGATDIELVHLAGRSWIPERRKRAPR